MTDQQLVDWHARVLALAAEIQAAVVSAHAEQTVSTREGPPKPRKPRL